eukprot:364708-Chlamydomonas_euryale.AAC.1
MRYVWRAGVCGTSPQACAPMTCSACGILGCWSARDLAQCMHAVQLAGPTVHTTKRIRMACAKCLPGWKKRRAAGTRQGCKLGGGRHMQAFVAAHAAPMHHAPRPTTANMH